ncbi:MAG: hypothetical protein ACK53Y_04565, partial [bacterium]
MWGEGGGWRVAIGGCGVAKRIPSILPLPCMACRYMPTMVTMRYRDAYSRDGPKFYSRPRTL